MQRNRKLMTGLAVALALLSLAGASVGIWLRSTPGEPGDPAVELAPQGSPAGRSYRLPIPDMAADCRVEPSGENYTGVRYKALLVQDELSESVWTLLFAGSGFTGNGEYQPHFMDLMIKAGNFARLYDDPLCASGFPPVNVRKNFTIEFGLSDYEDALYGAIYDNDIGAWTRDPGLLPRMYTNIDSSDPGAADKIMVEYQVDTGGTLEGREIEVSFVRAEMTTLPPDRNYYMDPDLAGGQNCAPNRQDDITYRHWIATLGIPSLGIERSVDFYIDATQGDKLRGTETLNFMWETPGRPAIESDKFKVILYEPEVRLTSGQWIKVTKFLVDIRTAPQYLPLVGGKLAAGYRKTSYKGLPAIEASFGYGHTDYVTDGDLYSNEPSTATMGVIELAYPSDISGRVADAWGDPMSGVVVSAGAAGTATTDQEGRYSFVDVAAGGYTITPEKGGCVFSPASRTVVVPPDAPGVDFAGQCTFGVSGRVVHANRQPFAGVTVRTGPYSDLSDEQGAYEIRGLEPGAHILTPELEGYRFSPSSREVTVPPDARSQDFAILTQPVSITLTPGQPATLSYADTQGLITRLDFPAGAVAQTTTLVLTPTLAPGDGGFALAGHAFELAAYQEGSRQPGLSLGAPATVTIHYSDADLLLISGEEQLALWWRDDGAWQDASGSCTPASAYDRDLQQNVLSLPVCHLSLFGMFGPTHPSYLPMIFRSD